MRWAPNLSFGHLRHQIRLMLAEQRFDDQIEFAFQHAVELVDGKVDPVIGHAPLRKIVGADALGTITRADQIAPILCLLSGLLIALALQQSSL